MNFDKILDNNTLWAVRYDGEKDNALQTLLEQWSDPEWLVDFFLTNVSDLMSYFKIIDYWLPVNQYLRIYHDFSPSCPNAIMFSQWRRLRTFRSSSHTRRSGRDTAK